MFSLSTKLTPEQISFLQNLGLDPNSIDLKIQIQNLINLQNSSQSPILSKKNDLSQILTKTYSEIIPELQKLGKTWDIDYDFDRKENKRYENLKKRGCGEILKVFGN